MMQKSGVKLVVLTLAAALALGSTACKKDPEATPSPTGSASTATEPAPVGTGSAAPSAGAAASGAQPPAGRASAYEGKYTTTAVTSITVPDAAKWKGEEGNEGVGEGKLALDVTADGRVTGTVDGALGAGLVDGRLDGDTLAATIRRQDPTDNGFYGTISAKITADKGEGTLQASRGNAGLVREGKLTLAKK